MGQCGTAPFYYGVRVYVQTRLPALVLDLLPPELQAQVDAHIGERQEQLRTQVVGAGGRSLRCTVLGIPVAPADVHLIPYYTYAYDGEHGTKVVTPWLHVVSPEVAQARRLRTYQPGSVEHFKVGHNGGVTPIR
jgi:hypothetical protein